MALPLVKGHDMADRDSRPSPPEIPAPDPAHRPSSSSGDDAAGWTTENNGRRVALTAAGAALAFVLAISMFFLASCTSFLTTCDADPRALMELDRVKGEAARYWSEKYGEDLKIKSAAFARELYAGTDIGSYRLDDVLIQTEDGYRIFYRDDDKLLRDNRQAPVIQKALREWLAKRLEQAVGDSAKDGWKLSVATLDSQRWQFAGQPGNPDTGKPERSREYQPPVFSIYEHASEEDESWSGFSTYYDGDLDAFLDQAKKTGELAMPAGDLLFLGFEPADGGEVELPVRLDAGEVPGWRAQADALVDELDDVFAERPRVNAVTTYAAYTGQSDAIDQLGWYEPRGLGEEPEEPVTLSYVPLDGKYPDALMVSSAMPGIVLHRGDVSLEELKTVGERQVNDALAALDDWPVTLKTPVWRLSFSDSVRKQLSAYAERVGSPSFCVFVPSSWAEGYGIPSDSDSWSSGESVPEFFSMEVANVAAGGRLSVGAEGTTYGVEQLPVSDVEPSAMWLQRDGDERLLLGAVEHPE